ncbi:MAG: succinylglutamate-semialdehyde dehydrogenase [Chlamydiales bacterium]|nr:succinylglutamate-semialdehyde dehydrogenase [Chlamydiales bacterium]
MEKNREHYINGEWIAGTGEGLSSTNPADNTQLWSGREAAADEVDAAVAAAKEAFPKWSVFSAEQRIAHLQAFNEGLKEKKEHLAHTISKEVGKPLWESRTEVDAMIGKLAISIEAYKARSGESIRQAGALTSVTRHHPHGVLAVFGPYNFPGHLPNGHIIPALIAGNTIVFKPSELTPLVGEEYMKIWEHYSGLPQGVINLVQGGRETGALLTENREINGILFTGSWQTGRYLSERFSAQPEKILALEMGGNNPLIIDTLDNIEAAAYLTIQSAFLTSGQRCTCARRLILPETEQKEDFLRVLTTMIQQIVVGIYSDIPEPFMGTLVNAFAAKRVLEAEDVLVKGGAIPLIPLRSDSRTDALLHPGLIDVTPAAKRPDEEIFGPLLQVIHVANFDEAINEANDTVYGLAAGLIGNNSEHYEIFRETIRAGVVNWNAATTGASSAAPFGGIGHSGNHRPSAYYATDYCCYPTASLETAEARLPQTLPPGITIATRSRS